MRINGKYISEIKEYKVKRYRGLALVHVDRCNFSLEQIKKIMSEAGYFESELEEFYSLKLIIVIPEKEHRLDFNSCFLHTSTSEISEEILFRQIEDTLSLGEYENKVELSCEEVIGIMSNILPTVDLRNAI